MKDFHFDRQTLSDLELFKDQRDRSPSIFSLFNQALTPGGSTQLMELMMAPTSDIHLLRKRTNLFEYLMQKNIKLELRSHQVEAVDRYLELNVSLLKSNLLDRIYKTVTEWHNPTNEYYLIYTGIRQLLLVLEEVHEQLDFTDEELPILLKEETNTIRELYPVILKALPKKRSQSQLTGKMDKFCRKTHKLELLRLTREVNRLDAYIGIAQAAKIHSFPLPKYLEGNTPEISFNKLKHPLLTEAKPYDFTLGEPHNMCFLTGPNMAGKSTFLKALGIGVYLGHLGFPVPAGSAEMTVFRGMSTTINLPDNLGLGHSHYYAEVNRVREVTELLQQHQPLFVVFDELFRGTNVSDAREASTEIIGAFSQLKNSAFLVSTHIVEVAEDLKDTLAISFNYMDLKWIDGKPQYSYQIQSGVSTERLGMYILEDAGVLGNLRQLLN
ncbi:MAG: hypothetical protein R8G66_27145 [Cytophagales bacterium]|nr:hypothetical protein [Cytophagales bacterium]